MLLKAGIQLKSPVSTAEIVVVRAPTSLDADVTCGGISMVPADAELPTGLKPLDSTEGEGLRLGKRYADADVGIECLCTKPGPGQLAVNGTLLSVKEAKPLPSSD
ncbi:MAG TPA: hypothetical protein VNU19_16540 [Candidatus Acidoferrum sp.]|nr:hypothetical protein [Candidatus Acidoferrum sp.]